jgi:thioredoxin 1
MNRMTRLASSLAAASVLGLAGASYAGQIADPMKASNDPKPFTREAFDAAAAEGKTILVDFHAPWCPICRAQEPKVKSRLNGDFKHVVAFKVDYDSNVPLRKEMNVAKQSTLILFQGSKELARLSYTSEDKAIDELFAHAKSQTVQMK